jgi:glycosyltransferase involved in cell wall biosynthesis
MSPGLYRRLHEIRNDYDVFHAHAYHALPALAAALVGGGPLVFTPHYHGTSDSALRRLLHHPYRRLGAKIFKRAQAVICVSEPEAERVILHFPSCQHKIVIIPNGVDATAIASAQPIQMTGPVVLTAGRLERYKRVDLTLRALAATPGPLRLAITGDGPMRMRLERLRDELQLQERVEFLGTIPTPDVYRWMRTASVLVTMSTTEAMPVVVVEALAAGDRVVASDIPAHRAFAAKWPEAISLFPRGASVMELAALIQESARRPRVAVSVVTWDEVTDRTLSLYQALQAA